jgi:hypothetical protein
MAGNNIVSLNVTQTIAATPNTLQQTGAFISQGGTNTTAGTLTLLTQSSALTAILATPLALTSLAWNTGVVTATTTAPHGFTVSQVYFLTIAGTTPAGYSGTFACTITGASSFTYVLASNPGAETVAGTYTTSTQTQLQQMSSTFFAQGSDTPVYVLELGASSVNAGVAALSTYIANNLLTVYSWLVPREWDGNVNFISLAATYSSTTSLTYFFVTTTNATYTSYPATLKSVLTMIEAPTLFTTEFSMAAVFQVTLGYNPSSTNQVTPLAFSFLFGVTPYPSAGNQTLFLNWKTAGVNRVGSGSEGGISNTILFWGTTMDVNPFNYWYAGDWTQINLNLELSNAIINGSNNPQAPLYLDQQGINTLQAVGAGVLTSAVTFGLLLGTVVQVELAGPAYTQALQLGTFAGQAVINAVPFAAYYAVSPGDYKTGTYNGFSCTITPLRGFLSVTFNINLTSIVAI